MGQKFAAYDVSGVIIAYYDSVDSPAPEASLVLSITDAQWQECLQTPGYMVISGALVAPAAKSEDELLADAKVIQLSQLSSSCSVAICGGFASSALGSPHTYPSALNDQTNLIGAVASGIDTKFYCADSSGAWSYPDHTPEQIKQVLIDASTQRQAYSVTLAGLVAQVEAATTVAAVQAIVWP